MNARGAAVKFAIFAVVMMIASGFLFMVLGETRTGSTKDYKAVFADASSLRAGNSVRVAIDVAAERARIGPGFAGETVVVIGEECFGHVYVDLAFG